MKAWELFLEGQEEAVGGEVVARWLRPLRVVNFDARNLYLEAQDSFQIAWFEEQMRKKVSSLLLTSSGKPIRVHLKLSGESQTTKKKHKPEAYKPTLNLTPDSLDPEATLEQFFVSKANEISLKFISGSLDPDKYNPLFLYGPAGVGKSHLLMAIASQMKKNGQNVFFVRSDTFMRHVVAAIRNGAMAEFRKAYRHIDALIIDDVHQVACKGATQEELFHTFNALHGSGKQIILSANASPQLLQSIEPRLISRFEWGILLPLARLTEEETKSWMKKRARTLSMILNDETIDALVKIFQCRMQPLQSALHALVLRLHLEKGAAEKLSLDEVKKILRDLIEAEKKKELSPQKIVRLVAEYYGMRVDDLLGKSQARESTLPRQMAMYLCRQLLRLPFIRIGELFERDHSTVMTSVKQVEEKLKREEKESCLAKIEILRKLEDI